MPSMREATSRRPRTWRGAGSGHGRHPWVGGEVGPNELRVGLTEPVAVDGFVEALVAVGGSVVEGWPVGPGAYRVASVGGSGGRARSIALEPKAGGWPIELRVVPGDGRNALD